jgi:hypothetical protein
MGCSRLELNLFAYKCACVIYIALFTTMSNNKSDSKQSASEIKESDAERLERMFREVDAIIAAQQARKKSIQELKEELDFEYEQEQIRKREYEMEAEEAEYDAQFWADLKETMDLAHELDDAMKKHECLTYDTK